MSQAAEQLEKEVRNLVNRYTDESDLRIMDVIAALEKVKLDVVHCYHRYHDEKDKE